ncbi:MAG TPA: glycosyltransferase, partial [Actinomycetota bacterium]|nr:glycosyltransferase [Actinomycetota bacterium]
VGEAPVLFTVATELRRKGLGTLFEAFRIIRELVPEARLVVGGKAPAADIRALAVQHRVGREMRAVGFVEDLRAAYSAADALIFPTRFDPWGLPVIEAMACGTPAAVSARAGAAIAVDAGVTGTKISDPADPHIVARAAVEALRMQVDRNAIRAAVKPFAWPTVVDDLESVVERTAR